MSKRDLSVWHPLWASVLPISPGPPFSSSPVGTSTISKLCISHSVMQHGPKPGQSLICCSKKEQHIIKLEKHLSVPNFWRMVYWHHHGAILIKFLRVTTVGVMCPRWIWCVSWKLHYFDQCTFSLRGFIFLQVENRYLYFSIICFGNGLWQCFSDCGPRTCLGIILDAGFKWSLWSVVSRVALVSASKCPQDPFTSTNIYTPILLSVTTQCTSATVLFDVCLGNIN